MSSTGSDERPGLSRGRERLLRRLTDRKGRAREAAVLVEGPRAVTAALDAGARFRFAVVADDADEVGRETMRRLEARGVDIVLCSSQEFSEVADTESPQGLLAVAEEPSPALPSRASGEIVLVLDAIQDPGNAGTLVRAGAALGASRVLALDGTVDPWNAKAVRASAGQAFRLPIHRVRASEALDWLDARGLPLLLAEAAGEDVRTRRFPRDPDGGFALAVGNEGAGPRTLLLERASARVALPLASGVESLNAAMAGAILLWALGPGASGPSSLSSPS